MKNKMLRGFCVFFEFLFFSNGLMAGSGLVRAPDLTETLKKGASSGGLENVPKVYEEKNSYSSLSMSWLNGYAYAENLTDIAQFMATRQELLDNGMKSFRFTTTGSSMSFGEQALPPLPYDKYFNLALSLEKMNHVTVVEVFPNKENPERVRVKAQGGVTWETLINTVREETGLLLIPFDTPSSDKITVAGCIASNTFSRTSDVQNSYASIYIRSFELLTPKAHLRCSHHSPNPQEQACFQAIPGAMGLAGVIVAVEVDLRVIHPDQVVHTIVFNHTRDIEELVGQFQTIARENRKSKEWDQGVYAIIHEDGDEPYGILMGSKLGQKTWKENRNSSYQVYDESMSCKIPPIQHYRDSRFDGSRNMLLYSRNRWFKGKLIQAARIFTPYEINKMVKSLSGDLHYYLEPWLRFSIPDFVKRWELYVGAKFTDDPYEYTFYHNGYWEAHGGNEKEQLPNMHQAWVMDVSNLTRFMELSRHLLRSSKEFQDYVLNNIILQDVTPIPESNRPMSPIPPSDVSAGQRMTVVYQMTVALGDGSDSRRIGYAQRFCRQLSQEVQEFAHVHLLKETHIDEASLRSQYQSGIAELDNFRRIYDPDYLFGSTLWEKLLPSH